MNMGMKHGQQQKTWHGKHFSIIVCRLPEETRKKFPDHHWAMGQFHKFEYGHPDFYKWPKRVAPTLFFLLKRDAISRALSIYEGIK